MVEHHVSYSPPKKVVVCQKCHEKIHGNMPVVSDLNLKMRQYDMVVKLSVMNKNWLYAYKRMFGIDGELRLITDLKDFRRPLHHNPNVSSPLSFTEEMEKKKRSIMKDVKGMLKDDLKKVEHIKGLGVRYLAGLLAYAHPNRFPSLRKFLVYCGYKESAKVTGRYNRKVCSLVNQIVKELIMHKDERYYSLYLKIKKDLAERHPDYTKGKIDGMARNRVGTFLLKELYHIFKG